MIDAAMIFLLTRDDKVALGCPSMPNRFDLQDANLRGANLYGADLCGADPYGTNLIGVNLRGVNLFAVEWPNAICPDGTNSDNNGNTCEGLLP
jgi:uncharacterized protein YjbI with pentapeptide repeats